MTTWTTPVSGSYHAELRRRYLAWELDGQLPHAFAPDALASWLYCERCGCESTAIQHTS
jgi:hypothetical protein